MKLIFFIFYFSFLSLSYAFADEPQDSDPPNIILIMADDLGWGELSSFGQKYIKTQMLDRLAIEGAMFTQFYAGSSLCLPSRCSIMTGKDTGHCSIRGNRSSLLEQDKTIAMYLQDTGYQTAIIGKWALGGQQTPAHPLKKGFDYFFGFLSQVRAHNYYPDYVWENNQKYFLKENVAKYNVSIVKKSYINDVFIEKSLAFIDDNKNKPFFLYLPLTLPHINNELQAITGNGMELPPHQVNTIPGLSQVESDRIQMTLEIDKTIEALVNGLKQHQLEQNTLILFTSDNGAFNLFERTGKHQLKLNKALRNGKGSLYEGGIRVPLIAWYPKKIKANTVIHTPWAAWDILPSLLEFTGHPQAKETGFSFIPSVFGQHETKALKNRYLYWELHKSYLTQAIRQNNWKLVRTGGKQGTLTLYDLANDASESKNVSMKHLKIVNQLVQAMEKAHQPSNRWPIHEKAFRRKTPPAYLVKPKIFQNTLAKLKKGFQSNITPYLDKDIRLFELARLPGIPYKPHLYFISRGKFDSKALYQEASSENLKPLLIKELQASLSNTVLFIDRQGSKASNTIKVLNQHCAELQQINQYYYLREDAYLDLFKLLNPKKVIQCLKTDSP